MIIYSLYKKTHIITGLNYLGVTTKPDPYTYRGSGKLWKRHIKKHGYNVTTEILFQSEDRKGIEKWGLYYSKLWNIVESDEWANLIEENCNSGMPSGTKPSLETRVKLSISKLGNQNSLGSIRSLKAIEAQKAALKNRPKTSEHKENISTALKNKTKTLEHKANLVLAWERRKLKNYIIFDNLHVVS